MIKVAVDAMGGDHAPGEIVKGAVEAVNECPDLIIYLVGREQEIYQCLQGRNLPPRKIEIVPAADVIQNDDEPGLSVRKKQDASMIVAQNMVKNETADAVLSAGNTGALMAGGLLILGRLPAVSRPALLTVIPTFNNESVVLLDVGVNMDARPEQMCQYALMGQIYARKVLNRPEPTVGLLNVGIEHNKGNEQARKAYELLKDHVSLFAGNVEANQLLDGVSDVVVCDGFIGNVVLKNMEGLSRGIFSSLKEEFSRNLFNMLGAGILSGSFRALQKKMDDSEYGGAPLIGLDGICIKCHGSARAKAVKRALTGQIHPLVQHGVTSAIQESLITSNCARKGSTEYAGK